MNERTGPTQSGATVSQGLHGVREAARRDKGARFTALLHHVNEGLLRDSFYLLKKEAAPLIRYRTRDLTKLVIDKCPCGSPMPMHPCRA